uniref:uncharacterized protein LOC122583514 n=1 Tax=Erigeron canadensis TaxID=72917 RepID=UPI001CB920E1|nr:uncharacterized protein LOC122583514 [Erigeron canadensis]
MASLVAKGLVTNMIRPVVMFRAYTGGASSPFYSSLFRPDDYSDHEFNCRSSKVLHDRSMASPFANPVASNPLKSKSVPLFRPVATVSSRFYSTNTEIDQVNNNLKLEGRCQEDTFYRVQQIYKEAYCSQLSATRNLARLLNKLDERFHVRPACESLRWDVMEDAKALYLVRDMSDITGSVATEEYTHFDSFTGASHVFGCVRVYVWTDLIRIVVGNEGPNPGVTYGGFLIGITLPENVFIHEHKVRHMNVKNDVLKITIPKHENQWIHTIETRVNFIPWI